MWVVLTYNHSIVDNFNTPTSVAHILATQLNIAIVLIDYKDNRINMSTSSIVMLF